MSTITDIEQLKLKNDTRKSAVRVYVTYGVIGAYLFLATIVVVWLMWAGRHEVAIGVLGGVAGLAGSIAGFWFGSRQSGKTDPEPTKPTPDLASGADSPPNPTATTQQGE